MGDEGWGLCGGGGFGWGLGGLEPGEGGGLGLGLVITCRACLLSYPSDGCVCWVVFDYLAADICRDGVDDGILFFSFSSRCGVFVFFFSSFSSFSAPLIWRRNGCFKQRVGAPHAWIARLVGGPHSQICDAPDCGNPGTGVGPPTAPASQGRQDMQDASDWQGLADARCRHSPSEVCQCFFVQRSGALMGLMDTRFVGVAYVVDVGAETDCPRDEMVRLPVTRAKPLSENHARAGSGVPAVASAASSSEHHLGNLRAVVQALSDLKMSKKNRVSCVTAVVRHGVCNDKWKTGFPRPPEAWLRRGVRRSASEPPGPARSR